MKYLPWIIYAVSIVLAIALLVVFPKWTVDDAYITYRYADNLANHGELTWNVGEDPVEGYTGIALPVILALGIKLGIPPVIASHIIGVSGFIAGGVLLSLLLRRLAVRALIRGLLLLLYVTAPFMYTHAYSGLETTLFTSAILSVLLAILSCMKRSNHPARRETILLLLLLFTSLVRPEGVALAGLSILGVFLWRRQEHPQGALPFILRVLLLLVIPGLVYFLWRWHYYGQFLPNTFYAKVYHGGISPATVRRLLKFLSRYALLPTVGGGLLVLAGLDVIWRDFKAAALRPLSSKRLLPLSLGFLFFFVVFLTYLRVSLDMNFSYRFFAPFFPVLLTGIGVLFEAGLEAADATRSEAPLRNRYLCVTLGVLLVIQVATQTSAFKHEVKKANEYRALIETEHLPIGTYLRQVLPPAEWVIVHSDAGAIPFASGYRTVDFGGLNDKYLAHRERLSERQIVDYFYSRKAGALVLTSDDSDKLDQDRETALLAADERLRDYTLVKKFLCSGWEDYCEFVYVRNDLLAGHDPARGVLPP